MMTIYKDPEWSFKYYFRGSAQYQVARGEAVWNGRVPERYPVLIAFPESSQHVCQAVRYAKANGLPIGTKSGGHSWTASFLRDHAILLDLAMMNKFSIHARNRTAIAQPAAYGSDLNAHLLPYDLMFRAGHCPTVGLGGFLLQGGFGWNSRKWGVACENVLGIELVNADGELLRADAIHNAEYFWAARGAGCGFFGVITGFTLRLWPLPRAIMTSRYVFSMDEFEEVISAVDDISAKFPCDLEVSGFITREQDGFKETTVAITGDALSSTIEEAMYGLNMLHSLPIMRKCLASQAFVACTLQDMLRRFDDLLDNRGRRYEADNVWTDTPLRDMKHELRRICKTMPAAPSHLYLLWWSPQDRKRPDMAFSMEANLYIALYGIGTIPETDVPHAEYVVRSMQSLADYKKGIQLADENLPAHPGNFMQTKNFERLQALRKKYDPEGRFLTYIRLPAEFEQLSML